MNTPTKGHITLITGGVRSGKSAYAQALAARCGQPVTFVATAQALDEEFRRRIARHRRDRPATWRTLEEPLQLREAVQQAWQGATVVLVDDLTLWASNRLLAVAADPEQPDWHDHVERLEAVLGAETMLLLQDVPAGGHLIVVTQETGWGIVPPYALGRAYRDLLGRLNQRIAAAADAVYLLVAGLPVEVKGLVGQPPADRRPPSPG